MYNQKEKMSRIY